ncbi:MAG: YceH family protein, partial [Desulforhopalus sp.]
ILTDSEVRILGCLLEKELATPAYYPLSFNALVTACNQKSNRVPVVSFDEDTVTYALNGLLERKLVRKSMVSRVPKFEQIFTKEVKLLPREEAAICILLVRGPQTVGEIRGRTERLYNFNNLEEVQETLASLESMELVTKLPRLPGRKESRYAHLLSGEPSADYAENIPQAEVETVLVRRKSDDDSHLQDQIDSLRQQLEKLQREFDSFKSQFGE